MFTEAISQRTLKALDLVAGAKVLPPKTYLAGGTALAFHLGHRYSYDLDFFTPRRFNTKKVLGEFQHVQGFSLDSISWQTLLGRINTVKCTLFFYQYPLLFPSVDIRGISVADIRDIAAMKIAALSDRGTKRDFVDLYCIAKEGSIGLTQAIQFYGKKFKVLESNQVTILKSLTYFEDAEKQTMPRMIKSIDWLRVKKFFRQEVEKIIL